MKNEATLGEILNNDQNRDAVHIAIAPVIAAEKLYPGQDIGFVDDSKNKVGISLCPIGIVDPFLKTTVFPDQNFWLFLYPNTITALRHEWEHPAFPNKNQPELTSEDREWVKELADRCKITYKEFMDAAYTYAKDDKKTYIGSNELYSYISTSEWKRFWDYFEQVTIEKRPSKHLIPFSCSC